LNQISSEHKHHITSKQQDCFMLNTYVILSIGEKHALTRIAIQINIYLMFINIS
jgi:hypothetical protein